LQALCSGKLTKKEVRSERTKVSRREVARIISNSVRFHLENRFKVSLWKRKRIVRRISFSLPRLFAVSAIQVSCGGCLLNVNRPISIFQTSALNNRPQDKPNYSPEPHAEVYCPRLNFNIKGESF